MQASRLINQRGGWILFDALAPNRVFQNGDQTKTNKNEEIHHDLEKVGLRHSEYGAPSFHFLVEISNKKQ